jgi:hypothetical protein
MQKPALFLGQWQPRREAPPAVRAQHSDLNGRLSGGATAVEMCSKSGYACAQARRHQAGAGVVSQANNERRIASRVTQRGIVGQRLSQEQVVPASNTLPPPLTQVVDTAMLDLLSPAAARPGTGLLAGRRDGGRGGRGCVCLRYLAGERTMHARPLTVEAHLGLVVLPVVQRWRRPPASGPDAHPAPLTDSPPNPCYTYPARHPI